VSRDCLHFPMVGMKIQDDKIDNPKFVSKVGHYLTVPGVPWPQLHSFAVLFTWNILRFGYQFCTRHCHDTPVIVQWFTEEPPQVIDVPITVVEPQIRLHWLFCRYVCMLYGASWFSTMQRGKLTIIQLSLPNIDYAFKDTIVKEWPLGMVIPEHYRELVQQFGKLFNHPVPHQWLCMEQLFREEEGPLWAVVPCIPCWQWGWWLSREVLM
jgi:hypothetical protein